MHLFAPFTPKGTPMSTSTFPPPPARVDSTKLAEAAERLGMARREILDVVDIGAGRVIYTSDGSAVIDVPADKPDQLGQTGLLAYPTPSHPTAPAGSRFGTYADPKLPLPSREGQAWTLEDFELAASRVNIPAPTLTADPYGQWLGVDPVRAYALLLKISRGSGITPQIAASRFPQAAACRAIVLGSGWLRPAEAAQL